MNHLVDALRGQFTVVNLGCIGDDDFRLPPPIARSLTLVEIDAEGGAQTRSRYHRKIVINKPISGTPGVRSFRRNTFAGTCSFLDPLPGRVVAFGMERYCQLVGRTEMECETIPALLEREGVVGLDFLKTDVEGADFEIIQSCERYLERMLFLQCELRFRPFYESEVYFHEVIAYLASHGFEVLDLLHIDRWKYATPHRDWQLEGRAQWADFLLVVRPELLRERFGPQLPLAVAKLVIIASMVGKKNYAEYILQEFANVLPTDWIPELTSLLRPALPNFAQTRWMLRRIFRPLELFLKHRIQRSRHVAIR